MTCTIRELCNKCGLSKQRITKLVKQGKIQARRSGKIWLIEDSEVEKFLQTKAEKGGKGENSNRD